MGGVSKFSQVDTLPCSQVELLIGDGNGHGASNKGGLRMRDGIIRSFIGVFPGQTFWDDGVQGHSHIFSYVYIY